MTNFPRVAVIAARDIAQGEELTVDYGPEYSHGGVSFYLLCLNWADVCCVEFSTAGHRMARSAKPVSEIARGAKITAAKSKSVATKDSTTKARGAKASSGKRSRATKAVGAKGYAARVNTAETSGAKARAAKRASMGKK